MLQVLWFDVYIRRLKLVFRLRLKFEVEAEARVEVELMLRLQLRLKLRLTLKWVIMMPNKLGLTLVLKGRC